MSSNLFIKYQQLFFYEFQSLYSSQIPDPEKVNQATHYSFTDANVKPS